MFNFLVKFTGWKQSKDTLDKNRVLEYTETHLIKGFKPDGCINTDRIKQIPAIFAPETGGNDEQLARVGHITDIAINGRDVNLHYIYDLNIPPISNTQLENIAEQLEYLEKMMAYHEMVFDVDDEILASLMERIRKVY